MGRLLFFLSSRDGIRTGGEDMEVHTCVCIIVIVVFQQRVVLCSCGLVGEMLVFDFLELDHSVLVALEGDEPANVVVD